jgi:hypothetical protein
VTGHSAHQSVNGTVDWALLPGRKCDGGYAGSSWWEEILISRDLHSLPKDRDNYAAWNLEPESGSVKVARELLRATTRDWGLGRITGDAELVISELLTNALRHACGPDSLPETIHVIALNRGEDFVCAVGDRSERRPTLREPDFMAETGRGLHLVASFSRRWGVTPVSRGKFVWALLP